MLGLDNHRGSDDTLVKDWIKEYPMEDDVRAIGEALCRPGEAKWQGKEDKFQVALSCTRVKYPHKLWERMLKTRLQPNTTSTLNVREMVTLMRL